MSALMVSNYHKEEKNLITLVNFSLTSINVNLQKKYENNKIYYSYTLHLVNLF